MGQGESAFYFFLLFFLLIWDEYRRLPVFRPIWAVNRPRLNASQWHGAGPTEMNEGGGGPRGGSLQADARGLGVETMGWRE